MRKKPQTYTLSDSTVDMLKKYAEKKEWSLSLCVEKILKEFLDKEVGKKEPKKTFEERQAEWEEKYEKKKK
jgi:hypothetical protein